MYWINERCGRNVEYNEGIGVIIILWIEKNDSKKFVILFMVKSIMFLIYFDK